MDNELTKLIKEYKHTDPLGVINSMMIAFFIATYFCGINRYAVLRAYQKALTAAGIQRETI